MPKAALLFVCLLASRAALAGDCMVHPLVVYEVEVKSCGPVSVDNVLKVGRGKLPSDLVKLAAGTVLVEGTLTRSTRILLPEMGEPENKPPEVGAWKTENRAHAVLVYGSCDGVRDTKKVLLQRPTDCACDTGRFGGKWCWLDEFPLSLATSWTKDLVKWPHRP